MTANSIELRFASCDEIEINKKEALRYLGYRVKEVPEDIEGLFSLCLKELSEAAKFKACFTKTKINFCGEGNLDLGFGKFKSFNLEKNLSGCNEAYVFAATAGTAVDRLTMKYSHTEPSKSVVIDALASAAIEGWCNKINNEMKIGVQTKPRYSPGYGDMDLSNQKNILEFLDAGRKIGICLSNSLLMTPTKSVTAIVGVKSDEHN